MVISIFAIVDVFSRQALCIAMKNKNSSSCVMALELAIKDRGKPRVLTSDNDSSFLSSDFTNLLDALGIVLDVNVLGDHNALGIIDNFAKRIKKIFTTIFLTKKQKNRVDYLDKVINTYNHSEHKALNYLTPDEAGMKANKNLIEEINQLKSIENHTVSDLKIDDKVRIKISGTFKKGTEPTFSDKVYIVKKI